MKMLIVAIATLISATAFSQTLPTEEGAQVIRAVRESLEQYDLNCHHLINNGSNFKASGINWDAFKSGVVTIEEDSQPVITIVKNDVKNNMEYLAYITTNAEFNQVTHMRVSRSQTSVVTRNTGTIIRPRYVQITERKLLEDIECR